MNKGFFPGFILGLLTVAGCASVFPYKHYGMDIPSECYDKGSLLGKLGKDGWPDLPMTECKPDLANKMKCQVMIESEFNSLKADDEKCHADLQKCQQGPTPQ
jgi:hypothetical protein